MIHKCFTNVSPLFKLYFTSGSPVFHKRFTSVLPVFHQSFTSVFFDQKFIWPKIFMSQNFLDPKIFLTQIFFARLFLKRSYNFEPLIRQWSMLRGVTPNRKLKKNFVLNWLLGKIQYFKPMLFLFVFSLVENQALPPPPSLRGKFHYFF